jgi:DNA-binding XRE family transcriptional regulator
MTKDRRAAGVGVVEQQEEDTDEKQAKKKRNYVRKIRESLLMSKAELARKAGLSALTIDRIESGHNCRMDTKRKIILALGLRLVDKDQVFVQEETSEDQEA